MNEGTRSSSVPTVALVKSKKKDITNPHFIQESFGSSLAFSGLKFRFRLMLMRFHAEKELEPDRIRVKKKTKQLLLFGI